MFVINFLKMQMAGVSEAYYEGKGLMVAQKGEVLLASYSKHHYNKGYLHSTYEETDLLPEFGFMISTEKGNQIKESQKDDVNVIEKFVNDILHGMNSARKDLTAMRLKSYNDDDYVPVEVTEVSSLGIKLKTIDPKYVTVEGQLVFEQNLKIFSKVYPSDVWAKVIKKGERFNANINTSNNTFSITKLFIDYITDNVSVDDIFDTHNRKVTGGWLKLREFWTDAGFMVFVDITEEEDEELDMADGNACIEITGFGTGQFRGCLYGRIYDYEVEKRDITRDEACPMMLRKFINEHNTIKLTEPEKNMEFIDASFIKEYCITLNVLQSREVNPLLRYRILSIMRILNVLIENDIPVSIPSQYLDGRTVL